MGDWYESKYYGLYFIGVVLLVYLLCSIIEMLRSYMIDELIMNRIKGIDKICGRFDEWYRISERQNRE